MLTLCFRRRDAGGAVALIREAKSLRLLQSNYPLRSREAGDAQWAQIGGSAPQIACLFRPHFITRAVQLLRMQPVPAWTFNMYV